VSPLQYLDLIFGVIVVLVAVGLGLYFAWRVFLA